MVRGNSLKIGSVIVAVFFITLSILFVNQRQAHATLATDILCYINTLPNHPPVPVFNVGDCPEVPVDICPNISGVQVTVPPGFHVDGENMCVPDVVLPQCMDGVDNDGDHLIDSADPGCHSDGNPNNSGSYNPAFNENHTTSENTLALCSDLIDNDEDGLIDLADPDCSAFKPHLTIVKHTIGGDGTFQFNISGATATSSTVTTSDGSGTSNTIKLNLGTSTVAEDTQSGWDFTSSSCVYGADSVGIPVVGGHEINVDAGDNVTCTFTNTKRSEGGGGGPTTGTLVVKKVFNSGTTTPSKFSFTINGASTTAFNANGENDLIVSPGTYTVLESASSTYVASYSGCSGIVVGAGATSTCTIVNNLASSTATTTSDMSLTKTVNTTAPNIGDSITYILTVMNSGPAAASNVSVTDMLPGGLTYVSDDGGGNYASSSGLWTIGSLANGSSTTLHIVASVHSGTGGTTITNSATVANTNGDLNSANNTDTKSITPNTPVTPGTTPNPGGGSNGPIVNSFGGGGGNGPIVGSFGGGSVLGTSTSNVGQVLGASCGPFLTGYLRMGRKNDPEQVKKLQIFLNEEVGSNLPVTGVFGPLTDKAVRVFQLKYKNDILKPWLAFGLPTDKTSTGYVFKTTSRRINLLKCPSLDIPLPTLP